MGIHEPTRYSQARMNMIQSRNLTTCTYNEATEAKIAAAVRGEYFPEFETYCILDDLDVVARTLRVSTHFYPKGNPITQPISQNLTGFQQRDCVT